MANSKRRRKELERQRYQRRVQKWQARRRRNVRLVAGGTAGAIVAAGLAFFLVFLFSGSSTATSPAAAASAAPSTSASASASSTPTTPVTPDTHCVSKAPDTAGPHPSFGAQPAVTINTTATYTATLVTNCGTITFTMDAAKAPHTVNSFAFLAAQHFFDNSPCARLVTDSSLSVLQCGDPTGTGTGGPGYTVPDENLPTASPTAADGSVVYPAGTVAMANTGSPNSGGSQFFLVYADSHLAPSYTVFGHITSGLQVLQQIAAAGDSNNNPAGGGTPNAHPVLESVATSGG